MKVKIKTPGKEGSPYLQAGAPRHCFLPKCRAAFKEACVHGDDGHYYCSHVCADEARKVDLTRVQEIPRKRA